MSRGYSGWFQGSDGGPTGPNCVIHGLLGCLTLLCGLKIDKSHYIIVLAILKQATENKSKWVVFLAVSDSNFRYKSPIWLIFNALE